MKTIGISPVHFKDDDEEMETGATGGDANVSLVTSTSATGTWSELVSSSSSALASGPETVAAESLASVTVSSEIKSGTSFGTTVLVAIFSFLAR